MLASATFSPAIPGRMAATRSALGRPAHLSANKPASSISRFERGSSTTTAARPAHQKRGRSSTTAIRAAAAIDSSPQQAAAPAAKTRAEHNAAQAAEFARPDVVAEFLAPYPPRIEERLAAIAAAAGAAVSPDTRVIDAGAGTGALIPHILARGARDVTAVDLSPAMLAQLEKRYPPPGPTGNDFGVRTWAGDFVDLPVYMGSADAIFLNAMFGNVHDQRYALARAAQLLKPGGTAVVSHPEGRAWHTALRARAPDVVPHELPDEAGWAALLRDSPFELTEFRDDADGPYIAVLQLPHGFQLDAPVALAATVVAGFGRGSRDLAVPTANLDIAELGADALARLPRGVFFGWARLANPPAGSPADDSQVHKMVMNVGARPTVNAGDEAPSVEVHVLHDFAADDFRGARLAVVATSFLRPEMKFDGLAALQRRIKADVGIARSQLDLPELQALKAHPSLAA